MKSPIIHKSCRHRAVWRLVAALTLAASLCLMSVSPTSAQDLAEYFQLSYDPVTFDKTEIKGSEVFHITIAGRATCTQDLPVSASEASITSQVIAEHAASGTTVTLNPSYTITIKPFPSKKGETAEISQAVPLQFPPQAASGDYNIIGKIVEAKVKVGFLPPIPVTGYLPQEQPMGLVKYTAPKPIEAPSPSATSAPTPVSPPTSAPSPSPSATSAPTPSSAPVPTPAPAPTPAPTSSPTPPGPIIPWWVELIVLIAVATIVFTIVWFLRHRTR